MKVICKAWPLVRAYPAFPKDSHDYPWIVNVKLNYRHSPPTTWIEAIIDSGSPWCLFHSSLCRPLGIDLEKDIPDDLKGIIGGRSAPLYFHKVKIYFGSWSFETSAGFSSALAVAGILGRRGFFENFSLEFDPTNLPPSLEIDRIGRS